MGNCVNATVLLVCTKRRLQYSAINLKNSYFII